MSVKDSSNKNQEASDKNNSEHGYIAQPVAYAGFPEPLNDEIDLIELFSRLASQWRLVASVVVSGSLFAVIFALLLPPVYQSSLKISLPMVGNIAAISTVNNLMGGASKLPASPQAVFTHYYNQLRSGDVFAAYIRESNFFEKHHPDATVDEVILLADLLRNIKINIVEPTAAKKGDYIASPKRVTVSIDIENEAAGVELLNGFTLYANQRLVAALQADVEITIRHRIELLNRQLVRVRHQYQQERILTIKMMEQNNAKEIALLEEKLLAYVAKAAANRATRVANVGEALAMASSLGIDYPTTIDGLARRETGNRNVNTAITVVDQQTSSLYLQGTKYLSTLIETLTERKNDERHLPEVNNIRENIRIIKNDQTLASLKQRQSDDPWIEGLSAKLAEKGALKALKPDFSGVIAFTLDETAVVTGQRVKPNRKLIVVVGFVLSLFIALFAALIAASLKEKNRVAKDG